MNVGIILAGGIGSRFQNSKPKQYMKLNGKKIIEYSIEAFRNSKYLDSFICVLDPDTFDSQVFQNKVDISCVRGGQTRNESVKSALDFLNTTYKSIDNVFIHEAARPFITSEIIDHYLAETNNHHAVITAVEITDSIGKKSDNKAVNRDYFHLIQAPECFKFNYLYENFCDKSEITSTSHQLPDDAKIKYIYNLKNNLKITYPEDLFLAEQLLKYTFYRTTNEHNNFNKISNKLVLILGATGGLGTALTQKLKALNATVLAPSKETLNLANLSTQSLQNYLSEHTPDIIINCAAYSTSDESCLIDNFEPTFNVNVKSNLILIDYIKKIEKRINLTLISSSSSTRGRKNLTLYSASKAALNSIVESVAEKLHAKNKFINLLIPEKINTALIEKLHGDNIDQNQLLTTDEIVKAIILHSVTDNYGQLIHIRKGL